MNTCKSVQKNDYFPGCALIHKRKSEAKRLDEKLADKAEIERLKKKCGEK